MKNYIFETSIDFTIDFPIYSPMDISSLRCILIELNANIRISAHLHLIHIYIYRCFIAGSLQMTMRCITTLVIVIFSFLVQGEIAVSTLYAICWMDSCWLASAFHKHPAFALTQSAYGIYTFEEVCRCCSISTVEAIKIRVHYEIHVKSVYWYGVAELWPHAFWIVKSFSFSIFFPCFSFRERISVSVAKEEFIFNS